MTLLLLQILTLMLQTGLRIFTCYVRVDGPGTEDLSSSPGFTSTSVASSPYPRFTFQLPVVCFPWSPTFGLEADDLPSDLSSQGQWQPKATSQCLCHLPHGISPQICFIISHNPKKGRWSTRYYERKTPFT